MATDWRTRYVVLRGPMSTTPRLHRWAPGPPYDRLRTACGRSEATPTWRLVMVLDTNMADTVPRCRRCWP